ncbi:hypothetical protein JOM56_002795 [Amanita muscaria]
MKKKKSSIYASDTDELSPRCEPLELEPLYSPVSSQVSSRLPTPIPDTAPQIKTLPVPMSSPRIAIVISSMYGHISNAKMAEAAKQSVEKAGGQASIFQIAETLSPEILTKLHAPPKPHYPIITPNDFTYDGCPSRVPTRYGYGNMQAQWKVCIFLI